MSLSPDQRLQKLGDLFRTRNAAYGDNYRTMGRVLHEMVPGGILVDSPELWQRVFTLVMLAMKQTRYAQNLLRGGHEDSLDDMAVYAQMAAHTDALEREVERVTATRVEPAPTEILCPYCQARLMVWQGRERLPQKMRCTDAAAIPPSRGCGSWFLVEWLLSGGTVVHPLPAGHAGGAGETPGSPLESAGGPSAPGGAATLAGGTAGGPAVSAADRPDYSTDF